MNELEIAAFWNAYNEMRDSEQRVGQSLMNALRYVAPELYSDVSGTPRDCFYQDDRIDAFRTYLGV